MHRTYHGLFDQIAQQEFIDSKDTFDRIMAPCPTMVGRYEYVIDEEHFARTLRYMFDTADKCLTDEGTITFSCLRDSEREWAAWLSNNPGKFEEIPDSRFLVWGGIVKDFANHDVFVGPNIEYMRFKSFRRVGSNATIKEHTIPDDVPMHEFNRVDKGNFVTPIDPNPEINEADQWLMRRGIKPVIHKGKYYDPFKYWLVEFDHDMGNYIQIPLWPTNDRNFRWGLSDSVINHLNRKNKGTFHAMAGTPDARHHHRAKGLWLCYWMYQKFCDAGDKVLVPFGGHGEMTLAGLLSGCEITVVEANSWRYAINEDIVIEWQRAYG